MNNSKANTGNGLLIGTRPILEALESGKEMDKIMIQKGLKSPTFQELWHVIKKYDAPFQYVPIEKLNRITRKNHQGVIAFTAAVEFQNIEEVIARCYENGEDPLILLLDRVTDVRNFGAISRTAECTGVHGIVIPTRNSAPVNFDALKTSAGALSHIPVCREMNLKETIKFLKESGLKVVGCTEKTETLLYDADLSGPTCIIMGSEEDGISPEYLKLCDATVKLPMFGKIGSLNVSVATGALLYEVIRQRRS
ncbi:23S rRNA (guanosine(2251)-2'-O)-methyltransferase RlmB [Owenweeksia hongkongensis]|uniref:23S rRNA (guanosine(2251)-2'-O)-methyltransferase RlmB n=1 Tax=Owenweeksia hongkongensis TaxID=253245 RepID=UPI003A92DF58